MSRQVLSSVFPFLKLEWALTDTQLGGLVSVVSLTVAVLAVPLSLLGDRWGRVKSIVLMAVDLEPGHPRLGDRGQLRAADARPRLHRRR